MNILFVAKHDSGDNDDEGAVTYALRQLGHHVDCVHELRRHRSTEQEALLRTSSRYDLCLFFKWATVSEIAAVKCPRAFWFFDMVRPIDGDSTLVSRGAHRQKWMDDVMEHCTLGFCTDGDWAAYWNSTPHLVRQGRIHHLMQGADERYVGFGTPMETDPPLPEILFTGMTNHGQKRADHVAHLKDWYGARFWILGDGGTRHRKHGRSLADVFASVKIVVAPDGPNTDLYWSNRVYLTTGLGGFLLHPYCEGLRAQYPDRELLMYRGWDHLDSLIQTYLDDAAGREYFRAMGTQATTSRHLYRHRCEELIRIVQETIH